VRACLLIGAFATSLSANPTASAQQSQPRPQPQVLFSRSAQTASPSAQQVPAETAPQSVAASVTDAMRLAPAFTHYDFTIHLAPSTAGLEVELRATVRNTGSTPLAILPLQLSSSLHFTHIRAGGTTLRFAAHTIQSDADHTGALSEAAVLLPAPLAPGNSVDLVIDYGGTIEPSSVRLDRIGTPALDAQRSDWDRIAGGFTGLRGFGDAVWYPVASVPALLGDGDALFREISRQKALTSAATVSMNVTSEFRGDPPNVAVLDGHVCSLGAPLSMPTAAFPGVIQVTLPATPLDFRVPSLVLASRNLSVAGKEVAVAALPVHLQQAADYVAAGGLLAPLFQDWLGDQPRKPLLVIDLPVEDADFAEDGDALLASLTDSKPADLAFAMALPLAHAWFPSPRAWLSEGVPEFLSLLWIERTQGADKALALLDSGRAALTLVEPATPGESPGEPLIAARDAVYTQTKAAYVLWMLRSIAGDAALSATLRAYNAANDTTPGYFEKLLEHTLATQALQPPGDLAGNTQAVAGANDEDLHWFFHNWVDQDPGLPDLSILGVFSSRTGAGDQWLVSVNIGNTGYAEAEVPVTVLSGVAKTQVSVRVPARGSIARRILIQGEPSEVDVNDGSVPEIEASVHKRLIEAK
jgi:hypothetical protein